MLRLARELCQEHEPWQIYQESCQEFPWKIANRAHTAHDLHLTGATYHNPWQIERAHLLFALFPFIFL